MDSEEANRITGLLYGNLLQRDADKDGFAYYYAALLSSRMTLRMVMYEFFCSEEFMEKFIVNQTPNELAKHLLGSLFDSRALKPGEQKRIATDMIQRGVPAVIEQLLSDPRFSDLHGEFGIPRYIDSP